MNEPKNIILPFLDFCREKGLAKSTIADYRYDLEKFISFLARNGIDRFEEVDHFVTGRYVRKLSAAGNCAATINRKLSAIRNFLTFLFLSKQIEKDVSELIVESLRAERRLPEYMTEYEVIRFLESINRDTSYHNPKFITYRELKGNLYIRDRALMELMYASGCRAGEITKLEKYEIDFKTKTFRVAGKNGQQRIAHFGKHADGWLRLYLELVRPILYRAGSCISQNILFLNLHGKPLSVQKLNEIFQRYLKIAGIHRELTSHTLRHSFATHLLNANTPIEVVKELLGHISIDSTVVYTHVSINRLKKTHTKFHPREISKMEKKQIPYHGDLTSQLKRSNVVLDMKLMPEVDRVAKDLGISRSKFIRQAIAEKLHELKEDMKTI